MAAGPDHVKPPTSAAPTPLFSGRAFRRASMTLSRLFLAVPLAGSDDALVLADSELAVDLLVLIAARGVRQQKSLPETAG